MEAKKTVRTFSAASFLHDCGSDMVFSVWPVFVTQVLGANMATLGFIDGLGDAVVSLSQAVSGYYSDRLKKRKVFIWTGYLFGAIAHVGYALSPAWQYLIPFRILDRSGKMRGSPRDAIISDVSDNTNRGKHFGILRAMDNAGAVVGILLAFFLLPLIGYRTLFFVAAIPSLLAVMLVFFVIKEHKTPYIRLYKGISFSHFGQDLLLYTVSNAFFSLGAFSYSFLLIFASGEGFQVASLPLLYLLFTVVAALTSIPFGKLSDRIGRKSVLYLSLTFWAMLLLSLAFSQKMFVVIVAFVLYGLHKGAIEPVQKTFVAELAPKDFVASTLGGFQMVIGLMSLPASFLAGILWDRFGMLVPLYFSFGLTALAVVLLMFVKEKRLLA
ncbi:MAG: MFS transporter [Candidatus Levybacteria bacterium]|nr:MFS transporter [Candidatus Levybacteria bacterium]